MSAPVKTSLRARAFLLLAGTLAGLLILEFAARVGYHERLFIWRLDPDLGWSFIPGSSGIFPTGSWWYDREAETHFTINSKGLREREIDYARAPSIRRVLVLGDSFTEALQVEAEQAYPRQMERLLNRSGKGRFEVINAGVSGYSPDVEYRYFVKEGYRYAPDIVLVGLMPETDLREDSIELYRRFQPGEWNRKPYFLLDGERLVSVDRRGDPPAARRQAGLLQSLKSGLMGRSILYKFLVMHAHRSPPLVAAMRRLGVLNEEALELQYFIYLPDAGEPYESAWRLAEAILLRLQDEVSRRGAQLVVAIFPGKAQVQDEYGQALKRIYPELVARGMDLDYPEKRLGAFLEQHGIDWVPMRAVMIARHRAQGRPLYNRYDSHWNADGHVAAAEILAAHLLEPSVGTEPGGARAGLSPRRREGGR